MKYSMRSISFSERNLTWALLKLKETVKQKYSMRSISNRARNLTWALLKLKETVR